MDVYADDCTVETPTMGTLVGKEALKEAEQRLFTFFQDIAFESTEVIAASDRLVATSIVTGTDTYGGLAGPGKPLRFPAVLLWTVQNGRVVKERRLWDFSGFLFQRV